MKSRLCSSALLITLILSPLSLASPAQEAWEGLLAGKSKRRVAFKFVENDPKLPNVLLYGDSISIGYTPDVQAELAGKANVYRIHCNGGDSRSFKGKMMDMHAAMKEQWDFDWDVIHFNVGLHDLKYLNKKNDLDLENGKQVASLEEYAANLEAIIAYLKDLAPDATLIFATTTPVPENAAGRRAGDAVRYNQTALEVMAKHPEIQINDLYALTKPMQAEWWVEPGNVHYERVGQKAQAHAVASKIAESL